MQKLLIFVKLLFSLSLIYFATALIFFTFELKEIRIAMPEVLASVEKLEHITKNMKQISKDAASGAVSGTFNGIIDVPENIVKKTKNAITGK